MRAPRSARRGQPHPSRLGHVDRDTILAALHAGTRRLKVVDAGVIVELIANDLDSSRLGDEELAVPHLIDSEVTNVLRRLVIQNALTERQAAPPSRDSRSWP